MRQLLDTHVLIWFLRGDQALSPLAREAIQAEDSDNLVSAASLWEIAIKLSLGKLNLKRPFKQVSEDIEANGFSLLPIEFRHLERLLNLPFHHKDPFDRLLIVQAQTEGIPLLSADDVMSLYEVERIW